MKKIVFSIFIVLICFIALPITITSAKANTIADLRKELDALNAKYSSTQVKKAETTKERKEAEQNVIDARIEIDANRKATDEAKIAIENLNIEMAKTEESIKKIIEINQETNGENIYLEYIFNSSSYAEYVYRYSLVKHIADYTGSQLELYEEQIVENEQLKEELAEREKELERLIDKLEVNITSLNRELGTIAEEEMDIQADIKSTRDFINALVDIGCGENDDIEACIAIKGSPYFRKPLKKGIVTSLFGYRIHPVTKKPNNFHGGIDLAGNPEGTPIYAVATGVVAKVYVPSGKECGGKRVYIYHTVNGKKYTSGYLHMLDINVKVGQQVTWDTVIGTVGGGSKASKWETCSTGAHLHLSLATGWYGVQCGNSSCYLSSATHTANLIDPKTPVGLPGKGGSWSSR